KSAPQASIRNPAVPKSEPFYRDYRCQAKMPPARIGPLRCLTSLIRANRGSASTLRRLGLACDALCVRGLDQAVTGLTAVVADDHLEFHWVPSPAEHEARHGM